MRVVILFFLVIILLINPAYSITWQRTYGGSGADCGKCVIQDSEGYYVVAGYTTSFGVGGKDIWVLKVDSLGDTVWARTFGGSSNESVCDIFNTSDSCYLITSYSSSYGIGSYFIIKINSNGDSIFAKIIQDSYQIILESSDICPDDGLVLAGEIYYPDSSNGYLVKVDVEGDIVFIKEYSEYPSLTSVGSNDDGSFITTPGISQTFITKLVKLDSMGNEIWSMSYDSIFYWGLSGDPLKMAYPAYDSGYYFVVSFMDIMGIWEEIWFADSNGNLIINMLENNLEFFSESHITYLKEIENIGFLTCTQGISSGGRWSTYGVSNLFSKYFFHDPGMPDDTFGILYSGYPCLDNGYIFTGYISYSGNSELVILKTDSTGSVGIQEDPPVVITDHQISVQWCNKQKHFELSIPIEIGIEFKVYDLQGRLVDTPISGSLSPGTHQIHFHTDRSGIYFYRLESSCGTETGKFMVVR